MDHYHALARALGGRKGNLAVVAVVFLNLSGFPAEIPRGDGLFAEQSLASHFVALVLGAGETKRKSPAF